MACLYMLAVTMKMIKRDIREDSPIVNDLAKPPQTTTNERRRRPEFTLRQLPGDVILRARTKLSNLGDVWSGGGVGKRSGGGGGGGLTPPNTPKSATTGDHFFSWSRNKKANNNNNKKTKTHKSDENNAAAANSSTLSKAGGQLDGHVKCDRTMKNNSARADPSNRHSVAATPTHAAGRPRHARNHQYHHHQSLDMEDLLDRVQRLEHKHETVPNESALSKSLDERVHYLKVEEDISHGTYADDDDDYDGDEGDDATDLGEERYGNGAPLFANGVAANSWSNSSKHASSTLPAKQARHILFDDATDVFIINPHQERKSVKGGVKWKPTERDGKVFKDSHASSHPTSDSNGNNVIKARLKFERVLSNNEFETAEAKQSQQSGRTKLFRNFSTEPQTTDRVNAGGGNGVGDRASSVQPLSGKRTNDSLTSNGGGSRTSLMQSSDDTLKSRKKLSFMLPAIGERKEHLNGGRPKSDNFNAKHDDFEFESHDLEVQ